MPRSRRSAGFFVTGFDSAFFHGLRPVEQRLALYLSKMFVSQELHLRHEAELYKALPIEATRLTKQRQTLREAVQGLLDKGYPNLAGFTFEKAVRANGLVAMFHRREKVQQDLPQRGLALNELPEAVRSLVEDIVEETADPDSIPMWVRAGPGPRCGGGAICARRSAVRTPPAGGCQRGRGDQKPGGLAHHQVHGDGRGARGPDHAAHRRDAPTLSGTPCASDSKTRLACCRAESVRVSVHQDALGAGVRSSHQRRRRAADANAASGRSKASRRHTIALDWCSRRVRPADNPGFASRDLAGDPCCPAITGSGMEGRRGKKNQQARLAVLIDADNTSAKWTEAIFREVASLGEASVRRIYGDFSGTHLRAWKEQLEGHALIPHQQFAYTQGKNSSDIALVIDAMDLLHTGRFDGFVLVTSDSDFTRLASRIREQGLPVYGIGKNNTPSAFRRACKQFIFIENLMPEVESTLAPRAGCCCENEREQGPEQQGAAHQSSAAHRLGNAK